MQQEIPLFRITVINQGLKMLGKWHVDAMLAATLEAQACSDMVVGYDMVCEEDKTPPISEFCKEILEAQAKSPKGMDLYLHAGESFSKMNDQIIDAVLLGTKRIGHGYNLIQHPEMIQMVKDRDICLECCPCSNKVLGQILDTRCHPVRTLMQMGVPVSINSDDPGFWAYEGVTLDYVYAYVAWDLTLSELKKLCRNTITYSSIKQEDKAVHMEFFEKRWIRFLNYVRGRY